MLGAVLAYHAQNCGGYDYASNDHLAFEADLAAIAKAGLKIVSLESIAQALRTGQFETLPERFIGLSCDDGTSLDWEDYDHPTFGLQVSLANILRAHASRFEWEAQGLLTSFVIACRRAREAIDLACYDGTRLSDDRWWSEAAADGLLDIGNHSFDHVHEVLPAELQVNGTAGDFSSVDDYARASQQVACATRMINQTLSNREARVFAYPYGQSSHYLVNEYFPKYEQEHGMLGAFTTVQAYVDETTGCYEIPRFVCGDAWRSPEEFEQLLEPLTRPRVIGV